MIWINGWHTICIARNMPKKKLDTHKLLKTKDNLFQTFWRVFDSMVWENARGPVMGKYGARKGK
jgi:hypothetical protein